MNSYAKFGGASRHHFSAICEKPMGGTYVPQAVGEECDINPRPFSVFRHLRQWRGAGTTPPPGDRPLMIVELRRKNQSTRLDEISRLHILFLVLGQHLT